MLVKRLTTVSAVFVVFAGIASAQVGVDGLLGSEWTGVTAKSAVFNSTAPVGNFGAPGSENHTVAYDIYARSDANYIYGLALALPASGDAYSTGLNFWNLYVDTNPFTSSGSDLGFEFQNDRAFIPGVPGYYNSMSSFGIVSSTTAGPTGGGVEFAIPVSYLTSDPQSIGFQTLGAGNEFVRFNLSQAWGYSVIGGQASYGTERLGLLQPVPEPGTMAVLGLGSAALLRRRRKK